MDCVKNDKKGVFADFTLNFNLDRPIKILQVTDTQIIDSSQMRYKERLHISEYEKWQPQFVYDRMEYYLEGVISKTQPDVIVHTGDFVYGEFDDSGRMLKNHIEIMDKYGIPWALALGNHERETAIGIDRLCGELEKSKHGLFKGENAINGNKIEGRGNYSILINNNGKSEALLIVLDSGCGTEEWPGGFHKYQKEWVEALRNEYCSVPTFVYFHIQPRAFVKAAEELYGYNGEDFKPFEIPCKNGNFGYWGERVLHPHCVDFDYSMFEIFKRTAIKGVFVGHDHKNSASILYQGVRLTYGLKTGEYDYHFEDRLGGTLMTVPIQNAEGYELEHVYVRKDN